MDIEKITNKTPKQLEFIGTVFKKKGFGELTVIDSYKKGNNTLFSVNCSICSQDAMLFPEEEMLISKNNLSQGKYPCSCSSGWKPSQKQYEVLAKRYAASSGDTVLTFKPTLRIYTPSYGTWEVKPQDYIKGKRSENETNDNRKNNLRMPDEWHINRFMSTGKFQEGTIFWRSDKLDTRGYNAFWKYTCPVCSNDEYVSEGLCNGIFEGATSTLKVGNKSCRCSNTFHWTADQRKYQILNKLKLDGGIFLHWIGEYKDSFSKFKWVCNKGHTPISQVSNFIHLNQRCKTCADNDWGFYKHKSEEEDTLYLLKFKDSNECFYKVGRTFKTKDRFSYFRGFYDVRVLDTITGIHRNILDKEKYLKQILTSEGYHYTPHTSFDGHQEECFTSGILNHPEIISTFNMDKWEIVE